MPAPPIEDLRPWFIALHELEKECGGKPIDWAAWMGNSHPVEMDIGSGRGLFLHTASGANPSINYVGVEIEFKEGRRSAKRLQKAKRDNARVIGGDAHYVLRHLVAPGSVDAVHVYFPDPWWKKKHRGRRVFNEAFVDLALVALKPGGLLHSWTDVAEYFGVISGLMDHHPGYVKLDPPAARAAEHDMDYQTSFERKARKLGTVINRGLWRKKA
jgi:tRNA (guanine-N7-)-methyltransferase